LSEETAGTIVNMTKEEKVKKSSDKKKGKSNKLKKEKKEKIKDDIDIEKFQPETPEKTTKDETDKNDNIEDVTKGKKVKKNKDKKKDKTKKKRKENTKEVDDPKPEPTRDPIEDDSDSDSDDLFNAVAQWADKKEVEDSGSKTIGQSHRQRNKADPTFNASAPYNPMNMSIPGTGNNTDQKRNSCFSVHVTNLPLDATKLSIHHTFTEKGCDVISTRQVYNHHVSRDDRQKNITDRKNGFTGVAFVDFADKKSYDTALEMHQTPWDDDDNVAKTKKVRGMYRRRINVRPTKTKEELSQIVERTKEKLTQDKLAWKLTKSNPPDPENIQNASGSSPDKIKGNKKKSGQENTKGKGKSGGKKREASKSNSEDSNDGGGKRQKKEPQKLTKKERAKRAAILRRRRN